MSDNQYDRLKGDPDVLRSKAQHYANIADAITRSVTTLKKIHDVDGMKSKATDALKQSAQDVADDIDKARDRYAVTAQALITYSSKLREAQDAADLAIIHIGDKQSAADSAHRTATTAQQDAQDAPADDNTTQKTAADKAGDTATSADTALASAQKEWHDALDLKNSAADIAVKAIVEVVDGKKNNGLKDSWWDDWGSKIYSVFKTICDWAGILSIFLGWVPILGQILIVLGTIGAVLDLVDSIVKAITEGGSLWDVALAAGGVALSFVGGKAFSQLAKNLKSSAIMKTLPKAIGNTGKMKSLRGILKVKSGESLVPQALAASKNLKMGVKDTVKSMFKGSVKDLKPKALLGPGKSSFKDVVGALKEAKIIPDLSPTKLLGLKSEVVDVAKMIKLNPALLKDPQFAVPLAGVAAYQAYETNKAVQKLDDPSTYLNDKIYSFK